MGAAIMVGTLSVLILVIYVVVLRFDSESRK